MKGQTGGVPRHWWDASLRMETQNGEQHPMNGQVEREPNGQVDNPLRC